MKKIAVILSMAALIAAGCAKEITGEVALPGYKTVTFDCGTDSKVELNAGNGQLSWSSTAAEYLGMYSFVQADVEGDAKGSSVKFTKAAGESKFTGSIVKNAVKAYAIYPFYSSGTVSSSTAGVMAAYGTGRYTGMLTQAQTLVKDGVNSCSNLSIGEAVIGPDGNLSGTLKNVCAYLKFKLANSATTPVCQILIESVNNKKISGLARLSFDEFGNPVSECVGSTYVIGINSDGSAFEDGTYYMTILPVDLTTAGSEGLHITMTGTDGKIYEYTTPGFIAERNKVYNLGVIDGKSATPSLMSLYLNASETPMASSTSTSLRYLEVGGYQVGYKTHYKSGSNYLMKNGGILVTPAIEGKILKKINVVFNCHSSNQKAQMSVRYSDDPTTVGSKYLTGSWIATQTGITDNKDIKFLMTANSVAKYFHQFYLGHNGDRESGRTDLTDPLPNTSYQLISNGDVNGLATAIELVYEAAPAE